METRERVLCRKDLSKGFMYLGNWQHSDREDFTHQAPEFHFVGQGFSN